MDFLLVLLLSKNDSECYDQSSKVKVALEVILKGQYFSNWKKGKFKTKDVLG